MEMDKYVIPNKCRGNHSVWRMHYLPFSTMEAVVDDVNTLATPYDGLHTTQYAPIFVLGIFTLGIAPLVWHHRFAKRLQGELQRRHINCQFGPKTLWGWDVCGILLLVGPFIYYHRMFEAVNLLCEAHNADRLKQILTI